MNRFITALILLTALLIASSALADTDDKGPVLLLEYTSLDLPADDNLTAFRLMAGWTFKHGFQLGANLTYYDLDRPSVDGVVQTLACDRPSDRPFLKAPEPYTLESSFGYWSFGPFLGWDVEIIDDWLGLEFMVTPTFPITNKSAGWSIETGGFAYFSFEGISSDYVDLALMGGLKFGHYDHDCDCYRFEENRMMPTFGAMYQF